jgi:hypothetical protein
VKTETAIQQGQNQPKTGARLLDKARALGLQLPLDLERLAIARGCGYYERDLGPSNLHLEEIRLSNTEVAIALLLVSSPPNAREVRLAAALLGAPDVAADEVAELAVDERCAGIVRYVAAAGARFEPDNPFWRSLLKLLPDVKIETHNLPHPTRFVEMTGIDRGKVATLTRWIRPRVRGPK